MSVRKSLDCGFILLLDMLRDDPEYRQTQPEEAAPVKFLHRLTTPQLWEILNASLTHFESQPTPEIRAIELKLSTYVSFELGKRIERDEFREHAAHIGRPSKDKPSRQELEAKIYEFHKEVGYSMEKTMKLLASHYDLSVSTLYRTRQAAT